MASQNSTMLRPRCGPQKPHLTDVDAGCFGGGATIDRSSNGTTGGAIDVVMLITRVRVIMISMAVNWPLG